MQILKNKNDFYTSVERALDEIDKDWRSYNGYIIVGSHLPDQVNEKIDLIRTAREQGIPILGICFGMQLMAVEFAKNVLGIEYATTQELEPTLAKSIVIKMPKIRVGIFKVDGQMESHWHNYKVNEDYIDIFKQHFDTKISEEVDFNTGKILEYIKLREHPFFLGVQYHPEYQSSKDKPHKILVEFLNVCKKKTPS